MLLIIIELCNRLINFIDYEQFTFISSSNILKIIFSHFGSYRADIMYVKSGILNIILVRLVKTKVFRIAISRYNLHVHLFNNPTTEVGTVIKNSNYFIY